MVDGCTRRYSDNSLTVITRGKLYFDSLAMFSPGNVSAVCRLLPRFDAFFRIGCFTHPPLTPTMSLLESLKIIDSGQEQGKGNCDTFRYFLRFLYVMSPLLAEIPIQNALQTSKVSVRAL